jgi:hypothetical protein
MKTIVHEVGHAVVGLHHRLPMILVSVVPEAKPDGIRHGQVVIRGTVPPEQMAEVYLAGLLNALDWGFGIELSGRGCRNDLDGLYALGYCLGDRTSGSARSPSSVCTATPYWTSAPS